MLLRQFDLNIGVLYSIGLPHIISELNKDLKV